MKVLFTTKMWEGDYKKILAGGFERKWSGCLYPFTEKWLIINNIDQKLDAEVVKDITGADRVIVAEDYAAEALRFFHLSEKELGEGYHYSICELVELYLAKDFDYLCHFASDVLMANEYDWITPSILIMENAPDVITTAPNSEDSILYGSKNHFFSDQMYLLKVSEWRKPLAFTYKSPELPEYPPRAGDALFERRAGRYLHNIGRYRQLLPSCWYSHPAW